MLARRGTEQTSRFLNNISSISAEADLQKKHVSDLEEDFMSG